MHIIDLRSDTVTQPGSEMREAMMSAPLGDDVFAEDPSINALQEFAANMFGMESALFCPSGTMTNQIAINIHTQAGNEVICDKSAHVYLFEGAGIAFHSRSSVRLLDGDLGRFTLEQVEQNINGLDSHYPQTRLVCIENTVNRGGGSIWDFNEIKKISHFCRDRKLAIHLDGARLFNALAETNETPLDYGKHFDTISICLSKGLGAPVGSLILGSKDLIRKAHRARKVMGGGMRQAGILAAAGLYALQNNVKLLKKDHEKARIFGNELTKINSIEKVLPIESNIVIVEMKNVAETESFIHQLNEKGIRAIKIGRTQVRFVFHLDISEKIFDELIQRIKTLH